MHNQGFTIKKPLGRTPSHDPIKKKDHTDPKLRLKDPQVGKPANTEALPDISTWQTRQQVADYVRASVSTIANYEKRGKLHPSFAYRADHRGIERHVAVYDPKEVAKLPRGRPLPPHADGEVAASCFEAFEEGKNIRETVILTRQTPDRVQQLHEVWLNTGGAAMTINKEAHKALEKIVGPFESISDLVEQIEKFTRREQAVLEKPPEG